MSYIIVYKQRATEIVYTVKDELENDFPHRQVKVFSTLAACQDHMTSNKWLAECCIFMFVDIFEIIYGI
jgi:hypothetical protein